MTGQMIVIAKKDTYHAATPHRRPKQIIKLLIISGTAALGFAQVSASGEIVSKTINQSSEHPIRSSEHVSGTSILPAVKGDAPTADPIDRSLLLSYLVDQSAFVLIDARSTEEFEAGHVDGAINVSIDRVSPENKALPAEHDQPILVYCKTNRRSTAVKNALADLGYSDVRVLPAEQLMFHDELIVFNCGA